ncbi:related to L-serine dehydratase 1 [Ustilago bromivora]|uniref:Related to L-serine dehydratase 1 n=1 Tax=Ustilago bromivora TaxID=307758 RepID=A0A1K0FYB2_9BASI|nr:related to L-serine dehydratase 1 [Ustilago bromivora]
MVSPRHTASLLLRNTARSTTKPTFQRRTLLAGLRTIESPLKATLTSPSSSAPLTKPSHKRTLHTSNRALSPSSSSSLTPTPEANETEHAVISTFDLFSVGIGPSSSHTVGPMRAGVIFVSDLVDMNLLHRVHTIKINLYGSLALTGAGHMTPQALLGGLEGDDCETVDPPSVPVRFEEIKKEGRLHLAKNLHKTLGGKGTGKGEGAKGGKVVDFDYERDLKWMFGQVLPHHSNGIRMSVFDQDGEMLATNDYYSVGGGFVVNGALATPNSSSASTPATTRNTESLEPDATPAPLHDEQPLTAHPIDWGENVFYKQIRRSDASDGRRSGSIPTVANLLPQVEAPQSSSSLPSPSDTTHSPEKLTSRPSTGPPFPFHNAASLLRQCKTHNLTIAQVVYENELTCNPPEVVHAKLVKIWTTMDECIRAGVESGEEKLPGPLGVKRRAPKLYSRLLRGLYRGASLPSPGAVGSGGGAWGAGRDGPGIEGGVGGASSMDLVGQLGPMPPRVIGNFNHPLPPSPPRRTNFPAIDYLTCYAIATNEQNASGGRIVTAPTNGAAGVLPSVLKYCFEFLFDDAPLRDLQNFLLTASAIGMLFKRGATLSAAEGGCMAEVGVATAMAAAGFVAVLGGSVEKVLQASVIGIEHNLGLTCDPLNGQVQIPCIERNALGAVKAVTAAQLALAGDGTHSVKLDDAITAMRETARDMHTSYKETSLGGLATAVRVPVAVPDC